MLDKTVQCTECRLKVVDSSHPDVTYIRDEKGRVLCPSCGALTAPFDETTGTIVRVETVETLTKRLQEIEGARGRVIDAQGRYEERKKAAAEARKHLDDETETFLEIVRRLTAIGDGGEVLPLFTPEAEAAAQDSPQDATDLGTLSEASLDAARAPEALEQLLRDVGYHSVTLETIQAWSPLQRDAARGWATVSPTLDAMPRFMRKLQDTDVHDSTTETATA